MTLVRFAPHSDTLGAEENKASPFHLSEPSLTVGEDTKTVLMAMAQEKVCQDLSLFAGFLAVVTEDPCEVEDCEYFGPLRTDALIREILMKPQATDKQLAEGWKELRRRFLADYPDSVKRTFDELLENCNG